MLTDDQILRLRLRAQQLLPRSPHTATVAQVTAALVGVQAQESPAAALSLRARRAGLRAADVEHALVHERSIVRTWALRGTLHLLAAPDLGWLLALLGPAFVAANRGRRAQLGLDDETLERGLAALCQELGDSGPLVRAEIVERLARRGIRLEGQAAPHLLGAAALKALVCCGPARGREPTYVLLPDWVDPGPALPREQARAELARRYLAAYAPAAPEDLAAWSGLSLTDSRAAWQHIAGQLVQVETASGPAWLLQEQAGWLGQPAPRGHVVNLLPAFDTYLLGYRNRDLILHPDFARRIYPGGGLLRPSVLVDGRIHAAWKVATRRRAPQVTIDTFEPLPAKAQQPLDLEIEDVVRFLTPPTEKPPTEEPPAEELPEK